MRISEEQIVIIREVVKELAGESATVSLFGSRLDDNARGGDIDLLVEVPDPVNEPALLAAKLSSRISRMISGRKTDILLMAPNLQKLPIHEIALSQGKRL